MLHFRVGGGPAAGAADACVVRHAAHRETGDSCGAPAGRAGSALKESSSPGAPSLRQVLLDENRATNAAPLPFLLLKTNKFCWPHTPTRGSTHEGFRSLPPDTLLAPACTPQATSLDVRACNKITLLLLASGMGPYPTERAWRKRLQGK